jgi:hypothetical protein
MRRTLLYQGFSATAKRTLAIVSKWDKYVFVFFPFCERRRALTKIGPLSLPFKKSSNKILAV